MDPLEEKIRKQFALIKTGSKKLLETDIIHSIEVKEKIAYIQLLFSSEQLNSQQQKDLQKKISSALLKRRYPLLQESCIFEEFATRLALFFIILQD